MLKGPGLSANRVVIGLEGQPSPDFRKDSSRKVGWQDLRMANKAFGSHAFEEVEIRKLGYRPEGGPINM